MLQSFSLTRQAAGADNLQTFPLRPPYFTRESYGLSSLLLLCRGLCFLLALGEEESHPLLPGIRQVAWSAEIQLLPQPFPLVRRLRRGDRALYQYRSIVRHNVCRYIKHEMLSSSRLSMKIVMLSKHATIMKLN